MSIEYEPLEDAAVRVILDHAPQCVECGQRIARASDAVRVDRMFRLRHRTACPAPAPEAA